MERRTIKFPLDDSPSDVFEATEREYRDLINSNVWKDIVAWLMERLENIHSDLEVEPVRTNIHKLQGAAEEIKALMTYPEAVLLYFKESDKISKETDND